MLFTGDMGNLMMGVNEKTKRMKTWKGHSCELCPRTCGSRQDLVRHMRTHTGEKPYKCEICGKAFSRKGNMIVHKLIHMQPQV